MPRRSIYTPRPVLPFDGDSDQGSDGDGALPDDVMDGLKSLINKQADGSPFDAAKLLFDENKRLRAKLRNARDEAPAEDEVVLTREEKEKYERYQELGDPEELESAVEERDEVKSELTELRKNEELRKVAQTAGYKFPVLKRLGGDLEYEVQEAEGEDEEPSVQVIIENENGNTTRRNLSEHAQEEWGDFMPALTSEDSESSSRGTSYPAQESGSKPDTEVSDEDIKEQKRNSRMYHV